jgi:hypothetical protein
MISYLSVFVALGIQQLVPGDFLSDRIVYLLAYIRYICWNRFCRTPPSHLFFTLPLLEWFSE